MGRKLTGIYPRGAVFLKEILNASKELSLRAIFREEVHGKRNFTVELVRGGEHGRSKAQGVFPVSLLRGDEPYH